LHKVARQQGKIRGAVRTLQDDFIREKDEKNNVQIGPPIHLKNIIPTISINKPGSGETLNGTIVIPGLAEDLDGIIEKVEISINNGTWKQIEGLESWNNLWDTTNEVNGEYSISVRSFDGWNYSEEENIIVIVINDEKTDDREENGDLYWILLILLIISLVVLVFQRHGNG